MIKFGCQRTTAQNARHANRNLADAGSFILPVLALTLGSPTAVIRTLDDPRISSKARVRVRVYRWMPPEL
jgi:hypothetical protein